MIHGTTSNLTQFALPSLGTSFRCCVCPRASSLPTTPTSTRANYTIQTSASDSHANLCCVTGFYKQQEAHYTVIKVDAVHCILCIHHADFTQLFPHSDDWLPLQQQMYICFLLLFLILSCVGVTTDAVWIGNWIYWTLVPTTYEYTLQITVTYKLMSTVMSSLPLFGSGFQSSYSRCSPSGFLNCPCASVIANPNNFAALHTLQITTAHANFSMRLHTPDWLV
jgi:hypothetical protein